MNVHLRTSSMIRTCIGRQFTFRIHVRYMNYIWLRKNYIC